MMQQHNAGPGRQNVHAPESLTRLAPDPTPKCSKTEEVRCSESLSALDLHRLVLKGQGVTEGSNVNLHVSAGLAGSLGCPGRGALKRGDSCRVAGR